RAAGSNNDAAALGGLVGQAEGRTSADASAGLQFRRAAGSNNDAAALGGLVGQAEGRTSADAGAGLQFRRAAGSNNDAAAKMRTSSMELEEARAAHRALQRENQRLLNENSDLWRGQSVSASPEDPATNPTEPREASPNTGAGSRNVQSERHPVAPINDRLLGRAVGNAHVRGVEHGMRQLTAEQEVLVFDLAAAMRRVPEVAMLDAITILFWELADDKMDFWPSRRVLLGAICAALKYRTAEQRWDLLNVYLYDPVQRGYIRNKLQDERHVILTKGRCGLYKSYDLYIQHPDKNRQLMGSTLIDAWKVQYKPVNGSITLHTWHCNAQGVPFSNDVITRGIAASFRREGEDVLILKLRQIAFWLFG
ncbi:unnamed protein product, partial [Closterium sp. Naga37s-1]